MAIDIKKLEKAFDEMIAKETPRSLFRVFWRIRKIRLINIIKNRNGRLRNRTKVL